MQRGTPDDEEKPQNASLLKGMKPEDVDARDGAASCCRCRATWACIPRRAQPVVAYNGRFGPYVKCGEETRSLPAGVSPLDVTLDQALELLAQPKAHAPRLRRAEGTAQGVRRVAGHAQKIQLLDGRYGLYVTDGVTNASLPKGATPEALTREEALELLAARAALGPPKKGARRKGVAAKSAAKSTAKKQSPPKKRTVPKKPIDPKQHVEPNGHAEKPVRKSAKRKRPRRNERSRNRPHFTPDPVSYRPPGPGHRRWRGCGNARC